MIWALLKSFPKILLSLRTDLTNVIELSAKKRNAKPNIGKGNPNIIVSSFDSELENKMQTAITIGRHIINTV